MGDYVLIIEDDVDVRDILREVLEESGVRVVAVQDGRSAIDHLERNPPPFLIVLDLMMPVMDGRQFRVAQRRDPALRPIPVAVLTADARADGTAELRGTTLLRKPVELDDLLEVVWRHYPSASRCRPAE